MQGVRSVASINLYAEEKELFLFAYDAPMTFQIHFCLTIINHLLSSTTCYLAHLSTSEVVKIVNSPLVNASTKPLVNSSICQLIHSSTHPLVNLPPHPLVNSSTRPLANSPTHQLIHSPTHPLVHLSTHPLKLCPLFSKNFNIMSAFFAHQLPFGLKKTILAKVCLVQK